MDTIYELLSLFSLGLILSHLVLYDLKLDCNEEIRKIEIKSWIEHPSSYLYEGEIIYCDEGINIYSAIKKLTTADIYSKGICIEKIKRCEAIIK